MSASERAVVVLTRGDGRPAYVFADAVALVEAPDLGESTWARSKVRVDGVYRWFREDVGEVLATLARVGTIAAHWPGRK